MEITESVKHHLKKKKKKQKEKKKKQIRKNKKREERKRDVAWKPIVAKQRQTGENDA